MSSENTSRFRGVMRVLFRRETLGWWLWGIYGVVTVLSKLHSKPWPGEVCVVYFRAGADFLAGRSIYAAPKAGAFFVYPPLAASLFVPFSLGPYKLMATLWRLINLGVFAAGVHGLTSVKRTDGRAVSFLLVSIIVCLLSTSASKLGQLTLTIGGLLMLAAARLEQSRLTGASLFMALSLALKPIGLPFVLLAAVVKRSTIWRIVLFLVVLVIPPFLVHPGNVAYVVHQYADVPHMLRESLERKEGGDKRDEKKKDKDTPTGNTANPALFGFLSVVGVWPGKVARSAVQLLFAVGALLAYLVGRSRLKEAADRSLLLYGIAIGYILLLSPGTERNTYALLAPVTGVLWYLALEKGLWKTWWTLGAVILLDICSHTVLKLLPHVGLAFMIKFFCGVVVVIILLVGPLGIFGRPREKAGPTKATS